MGKLEGMISRVLFHNKENGYTVASFSIDFSKQQVTTENDKVVNNINKFIEVYYDRYTGLYLKSKNFLKNIKFL